MPLPIAHTGIALACYLGFLGNRVDSLTLQKKSILLLIVVILANLPDLDFLPGIFIGQPNYFHHGPTHSILLAVITAVLAYIISSKYFDELDKKSYALMLLLAAISHTLLDYFSKDTGHPYGVPLLWPLNNTFYISSVSLFSDIARSDEPGIAFIMSIFNTHNFIAVAGELLFIVMILSMVLTLRYRHIPTKMSYAWPALSILSATGLIIFIQLINTE